MAPFTTCSPFSSRPAPNRVPTRAPIHLFNTHFVRTGLFSSSHDRVLAGMQRSRELADYGASVSFSLEDARGQIADARALRLT